MSAIPVRALSAPVHPGREDPLEYYFGGGDYGIANHVCHDDLRDRGAQHQHPAADHGAVPAPGCQG
ncbi:hypothetical protein D3C76_1488060 [compost metagenome]